MRTAEEILQTRFAFYTTLVMSEKEAIISAINEARKEAIEECAEKASEHMGECEGINYDIDEVLKSLIKELK